MAQINYDDVIASKNSNEYDVGFFSLKGDGAEAIVRIMCDSLADLDILTVHPITVGASNFPNRQINCLRDPRDSMDKCPLCASGEKVKQKVFIKMLQYDSPGEGKAVVWDRPAGIFVPKLKSYMDNYGPLSNIMCKIVRHGTGLDTSYDIIPNINPQVYTEQTYPKNADAFADFNVLGRMVMNKTAEEMNTFIQTGAFPEKVDDDAPQQPSATSMPNFIPPNNSMASWDIPSSEFGDAPIRRY